MRSRNKSIARRKIEKVRRDRRRFERQIQALSRVSPHLRTTIAVLRTRRGAVLRVPLALLLLLGGMLSFLPLLGLWMIPVGLVLLAIDLPVIQPTVSALIIRLRRRWAGVRRRWSRSSKQNKP